MTRTERGFLLLCGELGDGQKPLTPAQLRTLRARVLARQEETRGADRPLTEADLRALGYDAAFARRVEALLNREEALDSYLSLAQELGIRPLTRISPEYPARLRRMGEEAPAVLFCRGDLSLLNRPAVALVGSRELKPAGAAFARRVGELAAREELVLVSGNARGADRTAQEACLEAGGRVVAVLPEGLRDHPPENEGILYLCLWGWHLPMVGYRALERNRIIHCLGEKTLVAQSHRSGGTWRGSEENLRRGWSPLFVHRDGSPGTSELIAMGAVPVETEDLVSLRALEPAQLPLSVWKEGNE
ncbi:MAG: DNA-processing protein DprA [Oscillospiraceae bacterium]|nr:DNA-processing protein DprA [Oscillospiraceae bacterium]